MKVFFSVGEPSGDLHGANLIRELKSRCPQLDAVGYGGPRMESAGCDLHEDLTRWAVMGFSRVLISLHVFFRLLVRADRYFRKERPDAVVLIDYPGFNWWIARRAKAHGIPVIYYGAPQLWAWATWRVKKMRRLVDHVLCKLPFEARWYQQQGCQATYVGHPYFDELKNYELDEQFLTDQHSRPERLVAILPGSRTQEVTNNLPWFLKAAKLIGDQRDDVRFAIASFNEKQAAFARDQVRELGLPIEVHVGRTAELIHLSECCMVCSGSVSLELLYHQKPSVILYHTSRLLYNVARHVLLQVKYITLVNLLAMENRFDIDNRAPFDPNAEGARDVPFPEYPTYTDKSRQVADHIIEWLSDERERTRRIELLQPIRDQLAHAGASSTAAEYILNQLGQVERRRVA